MIADPHLDLAPCRVCVALVGNPNSGKTTLFNALTGSRYKVANYPGVTVEKKEGALPLAHCGCARIVDLPGTYALHAPTESHPSGFDTIPLDEQIVPRFLSGELNEGVPPTLVVAVVDATNLERNLFLVSQVIDAGFPLVLALNMMDEAESQGVKIYTELLGKSLDVPVIPIVARSGRGLNSLKATIADYLSIPSGAKSQRSKRRYAWLSQELRRDEEPVESLAETARTLSIESAGSQRYAWIRAVVARCTSRAATANTAGPSPFTASLDRVLMSKVWGIPIMLVIFATLFQGIFTWAQAPMDLISTTVDTLAAYLRELLPRGILSDLITQGIIPGVGNVIVFVPQLVILFTFIGILEDCGYLSRAAFLLDTIMRRVGLQGRAFIPLLSSFACAIPGILSTRSIPSRSDRLATIMIAPLMSCSARLPVYAVLIAAFIPNTSLLPGVSLQGIVLLGMYLLGIVTAFLVAWVLKHLLRWRDLSFFMMEMPPLRRPLGRVIVRGVYDNVLSFLKNAATIILACSIIVWFLAAYPKPDAGYQGNPVEVSLAGRLGKAIEPAIRPLGFNWEIGFAIISSFPAREVFVTGLSTVYNVAQDGDAGASSGENGAGSPGEVENRSLIARLQEKQRSGEFPLAAALALMVFYVYSCQCMSTIAVAKRETGSWGWTAAMFGYMTALAYLGALLTYQVGLRVP